MNAPDLPLVSIVIASYNHEKYIQDSIESVVNQSYNNIQFIVIDDGSSDNSPSIIKTLQKKYGFQFLQQENIGLSKTLNRAIEIAKGKYFVSFGSDDIMLAKRIETQVTFMENHPQYPITSGNVIFIDGNGKKLAKQNIEQERELDFDDIFLNRKVGIQAAGAMVRSELFEQHGYYDPEIPLEDMSMWFKLLSSGHKAYILADQLACYRKHESNTYKNIAHMLDSLLRTILPYSDQQGYQTLRNKILVSHFLAASKQDVKLAFSILKKIPLRFYSLKVLRGLKNCLITSIKK